jgi:hypothetical protein
VGIDQQRERVVVHVTTDAIRLGDAAAIEKHADRFRETCLPVGLAHQEGIGAQPECNARTGVESCQLRQRSSRGRSSYRSRRRRRQADRPSQGRRRARVAAAARLRSRRKSLRLAAATCRWPTRPGLRLDVNRTEIARELFHQCPDRDLAHEAVPSAGLAAEPLTRPYATGRCAWLVVAIRRQVGNRSSRPLISSGPPPVSE